MAENHYLISDASKKVDVEAHVLRYWEEELELAIPRNDMGHRDYTDFHIRLFKQVKMLKEKGYQLKAIKSALSKTLQDQRIIPGEILEAEVLAALKETGIGEQEMKDRKEHGGNGDGNTDKNRTAGGQAIGGQAAANAADGRSAAGKGVAGDGTAAECERADLAAVDLAAVDSDSLEAVLAGEKMERFQRLVNHIIGRAMEENSEKLSQDISYLVHDKLMKEMEYLMRISDEREEERFRRLDEAIRAYQRENQGRAEAAAALSRFPFLRLKKKKFGRNGNKL